MIRASRHVLSQPVSARIEDGWTIRCLRHSADQLFERDLTRLANKSLHLDVEWLALAWAQCVRVSRRGYAVFRLMTAQCERFRVLFPSGDSALGWRGGGRGVTVHPVKLSDTDPHHLMSRRWEGASSTSASRTIASRCKPGGSRCACPGGGGGMSEMQWRCP